MSKPHSPAPPPTNYQVSEIVTNMQIMAEHGNKEFCKEKNQNVSAGKKQNGSTAHQHCHTREFFNLTLATFVRHILKW